MTNGEALHGAAAAILSTNQEKVSEAGKSEALAAIRKSAELTGMDIDLIAALWISWHVRHFQNSQFAKRVMQHFAESMSGGNA